jgi:hypothetical protein
MVQMATIVKVGRPLLKRMLQNQPDAEFVLKGTEPEPMPMPPWFHQRAMSSKPLSSEPHVID